MKLLVILVTALAVACSNGQATGQANSDSQVQRLAKTTKPKIALAGRVTDAADLLDASQEAALSKQLEELERSTGHQMVVVTVTTLGGKEVAAFTRDLGNAWGIGRSEQDDGVILLVAPSERKVRIAVGHGLEKRLSGPLCQKIIQRQMLPNFRKGDWAQGIESGVSAIIRALA